MMFVGIENMSNKTKRAEPNNEVELVKLSQALGKAHGFHLLLLLICVDARNLKPGIKALFDFWEKSSPSYNTFKNLLNEFETLGIIKIEKRGRRKFIHLNSDVLRYIFPIPDGIDRASTILPLSKFLFDKELFR